MAARRTSPRKERKITRKVGVRPVKQSFLIVCEGVNTEPDYFNAFRLTSARVKAMGKGLGTISLVKEAIRLAEVNGFHAAWSNQAFEFWFILHFICYHGQLHRSRYAELLTKLTGIPYSKKQGVAAALYNLLFPRLDTAIANARLVLADFPGTSPANAESATTVFRLAGKLKEFME